METPRYWPIARFGVIGDCRTAALIAPDGSIDWLCLPHFDSPAILCRLLDADRGGFFRVQPSAPFHSVMAYRPETNILETLFETETGKAQLVDFMPIRQRGQAAPASGFRLFGRRSILSRLDAGLEREIGNDVAAAHRIDRMMTCIEGEVTLDITLKPTFDYAQKPAIVSEVNLGQLAAGAIIHADERFLAFIVRQIASDQGKADGAAVAVRQEDGALHAQLTLRAGAKAVTAMNYARDMGEAQTLLMRLKTRDFATDLEETTRYWTTWAKKCQYEGPYREAVLRSALALKLCTFEPTGAIVAAPTTSLPESIGGVRNWDYRYTWLRDSAFTLDALEQIGFVGEARDYFHFLHDLQIKDVENLRIMYGIRGEHGAQLAEREITQLEGYRGSGPVRVGNGAAQQRQLDIYGEVVDSAYRYLQNSGFQREHAPSRDLRVLTHRIADYVANHWQEVDQGIWEVRGAPRAFVYSRAMCWVALDRACRMARHHGHEHHVPRWTAAAEQIRAEILARGFDPELDSFTQSYGDKTLDAANLRLLLVEYLPATDAKMRSTVEVTFQGLKGPNGIVYRYRPADAPPAQAQGVALRMADDGLPGGEGAFLACSFWLISDLCALGRIEEARTHFERMLQFASPLGLFAEEIDPASGEMLGNFPQAFTHIGLINSAMALQRAVSGAAPKHTR